MRRTSPLILGAGPAGCAAAIVLAETGIRPTLLDRDAEVRDHLCGGFLSSRTAEQLRGLGADPAALGAVRIDRLGLFAGRRTATIRLPSPAFALSRRTLDSALRDRAVAAGARLEIETARRIDGTRAIGQHRDWSGDGLFLATGKHDLRGRPRPRLARDPALGIRLRLAPSAARGAMLANKIELHLFRGGYAGLVLQEDGSANLCLAVRKSLLARSGGDPLRLLADLAENHPEFAARLAHDWRQPPIESIGAVPYGWIARTTAPGLFRLGDQAAVIPSLAGEGISIALASGALAARVWTERGAAGAEPYQQMMARRAGGPVRAARLARRFAESEIGARLGIELAGRLPAAMHRLIEASRIAPEASLAPSPTAP